MRALLGDHPHPPPARKKGKRRMQTLLDSAPESLPSGGRLRALSRRAPPVLGCTLVALAGVLPVALLTHHSVSCGQ